VDYCVLFGVTHFRKDETTMAREMKERFQLERGNWGEREGEKLAENLTDTEGVRCQGIQMRRVSERAK